MDRLRAILPDLSKKDNRIIAAALFVQEQYEPPTILVTKDVNVQLKARAVGLESEDYLNDKVPETDEEASYRELPLSIYELQRFCSEGEFDLGDDATKPLYLNEYVLLRSDEGKTMPARYYGDGIVRRLKLPDFVKGAGRNSDSGAQSGAAVFHGCAARRQPPHDHVFRQSGHGQDAALRGVRAAPDARRSLALRRRFDFAARDGARQRHRVFTGHVGGKDEAVAAALPRRAGGADPLEAAEGAPICRKESFEEEEQDTATINMSRR
jgi:hypothetical protein